jgi:biotin carboxylase
VSARILVIEAISGGALLTRTALDLGLKVAIASADTGDRMMPADLRDRVDELIVVETNDHDVLAATVGELHRRTPLDAVFPGCDVYVPAAAHLAAQLGLTGLDVAGVDRVRDKARMRAALAAADVRSVRWLEVGTPEQLAEAAAHVGFPCVVKPVDQSGSLHVTKARDANELAAAYCALSNDELLDLGRPIGTRALVEEYLDGPEFSVEGYVLDGRTTIAAVTEKILGPEPHFAELGHVVPAPLTHDRLRAVEAYVAQVTAATGLSVGPFHCELRLTANGPVLVEIGARMGGDRIAELVELAAGVSLPRIWLAACLGLDPAELAAFPSPVAAYAAIQFFTAPGETEFVAASGLDELSRLVGVREVRLDAVPGDPLYPLEDFRCRIGHALLTASSRAEMDRLRRLAVETVRINPQEAAGA